MVRDKNQFTSEKKLKMTNQPHIATVNWRSPQHGGYADTSSKMLGTGSVTDGTKYVAFNNDFGEERFLFDSQHDALEFKVKVEDTYSRNPQYLVIDDVGDVVLEDGAPLVAWEPEISIEAASQKQIERHFSGALRDQMTPVLKAGFTKDVLCDCSCPEWGQLGEGVYECRCDCGRTRTLDILPRLPCGTG